MESFPGRGEGLEGSTQRLFKCHSEHTADCTSEPI
jgi:hypothetical protein